MQPFILSTSQISTTWKYWVNVISVQTIISAPAIGFHTFIYEVEYFRNQCILWRKFQNRIQCNPLILTFYVDISLITDMCFGLIDPHQNMAEISIDRKNLNAIGESNPGPTGERPVFYHYTNDFPVDKCRNNDD